MIWVLGLERMKREFLPPVVFQPRGARPQILHREHTLETVLGIKIKVFQLEIRKCCGEGAWELALGCTPSPPLLLCPVRELCPENFIFHVSSPAGCGIASVKRETQRKDSRGQEAGICLCLVVFQAALSSGWASITPTPTHTIAFASHRSSHPGTQPPSPVL